MAKSDYRQRREPLGFRTLGQIRNSSAGLGFTRGGKPVKKSVGVDPGLILAAGKDLERLGVSPVPGPMIEPDELVLAKMALRNLKESEGGRSE